MILIAITILLLITLSAFFSANEMIFSCVNILRLEKYRRDRKKGAKRAIKLAKDFERTLSTILVGNNLVNITLTAIVTALFTNKFGVSGVWISTITMTVFILLFGEFFPKTIAKKNPEKLAIKMSPLLNIFLFILVPVTNLLMLLNKGMTHVYDVENEDPSVTEEELLQVVETTFKEGVIEAKERKLIRAAINFDDTTINNIFTPLKDVFFVNTKDHPEKIKKEIIFNHFSRVPVMSNNEIVGILYEKDYLTEYLRNGEVNIEMSMREPFVARNNMKISNLLSVMKERKEHLAIVRDTSNRLLGIITLEDTIEYLVGEIKDEHDL